VSTDAAVSAQNPPDERLAALFANQRRWLLRMAAPAHGVVARTAGLTAICARYDGAIVLPVGRPVSGAALDAAFDAIRRPAPPGGVLVWSATGDEPLRTALARRLLARGCDEAFRPRWMERDLAATAESDAGHPAPDGFGVSPAESGDELAIAAAAGPAPPTPRRTRRPRSSTTAASRPVGSACGSSSPATAAMDASSARSP